MLTFYTASLVSMESHPISMLHQACLSGNVERATQALNQRVDPNQTLFVVVPGPQPRRIVSSFLHCAASCGHCSIVTLLLDRCALIDLNDGMGYSPLAAALMANKPDVADLLIRKGADIEKRSFRGCTPLGITMVTCNALLADCLIKAGANVNNIYPDGGNTLHLLLHTLAKRELAPPHAKDHVLDIIESLRNSDIELDVQDVEGNTPFHLVADDPSLLCSLLAPLTTAQVAQKKPQRTRSCLSCTTIATTLRNVIYGKVPEAANSISLKTKAQQRLIAFLWINKPHVASKHGLPSLPEEVVYGIFSHMPIECTYGGLEDRIVPHYITKSVFRQRFLDACLPQMRALINIDRTGISQRKLVRVLQRVNNEQKTAAEIATDPDVKKLLDPKTWQTPKE